MLLSIISKITAQILMQLYILLVILAFSGLSIYVAINNIKFEKKKMKVAKVLVVEKMTTAPPSLEELNITVQNQTSNI